MSAGRLTVTDGAHLSVPVKLPNPWNVNEPPPVESESTTVPVPQSAPAPKVTFWPFASSVVVVFAANQTGKVADVSTISKAPPKTLRMELKRSIRFLASSVPSSLAATSVRISMSPSQSLAIVVASTLTVQLPLPLFTVATLLSGRTVRWLEYVLRLVTDSAQVTSIAFTMPRPHSM